MRTMGDATHDNVATLEALSLDMVAGYVTGSPDIAWTLADWSRFPGIPHITIDQGFIGSPVADAIVRDVEPGAWSPANAVNRSGWTTPRPTIYCNRYDLTRPGGVLASGWRGDVWLAFPGWRPGQPLPPAPGCNYVAVQNVFAIYDLSVVLDDTWPTAAAPPPVTNWQEDMMRQLPVLRQGATGPDVGTIQGLCIARLRRNLGTTGPARDGVDDQFGAITHQAVVDVQRAAGFTPAEQDGIVGPQTWPALMGV